MTEPASPGAVSSNRNIMIVLSYLWLLALVPLLVEKEDKEVQWHAKHGIVLMVAEIVLWIAVTIVSMILGMVSVALGCVVEPHHLRPVDRHPRRARDGHDQGHQRRPLPDPRRQRVRQPLLVRSISRADDPKTPAGTDVPAGVFHLRPRRVPPA